MPPKSANSKAQAALEKKAAAQAEKDAAERRKAEAQESEEWKKGANNRGASRAEAAAQKQDEALRKKKEKEALLAAEEEELGTTKVKKSVGAGMAAKTAKSKKTGQNDLSLLEDALVSAADKKSKASKRAAQLKKEREQQKKPQITDAPSQDPLLRNTEEMIGGAATYMDKDGEMMVGSKANKALGTGEVASSGIDSALGQMSLGGAQNSQQNDIHPEKRVKALHMAFEEKMMPEMKKDYPGLKKSQYQEKIFKLWQKSPENPLNWPKA